MVIQHTTTTKQTKEKSEKKEKVNNNSTKNSSNNLSTLSLIKSIKAPKNVSKYNKNICSTINNKSKLTNVSKPSNASTTIKAKQLIDVPYKHKIVFVVNEDLRMSKGKVISQCMHAYDQLLENISVDSFYRSIYNAWKEEGNTKIVVKATEKQIESIKVREHGRGINIGQVYDAGRTEVEAGSHTVMALGPASVAILDELTGHLEIY